MEDLLNTMHIFNTRDSKGQLIREKKVTFTGGSGVQLKSLSRLKCKFKVKAFLHL